MAIANNKDLTHVVRTTQQWQSSYDKYECIPEGVLCIEFTTSGQALAKIGNGRDIFSKLPYIGGADLTNYFTKEQTTECINDILKAKRYICIKGILNNKNQLPTNATCGDLYFVISDNQSSSNKYDEYVYSPNNTWEPLGSIPIDIDLSEYAKIQYVDEKIEQVNDRIDDIEQHGTHTHANKDILDQITAPYTEQEKDKLSILTNYDDTELRELISKSSHTHKNLDILEKITAAYTAEEKEKLSTLKPVDISTVEEKITALERLAHEHSNKRILDRTTASFTTEYERKMRWIRIYTGCTGMEEGIAGLVPAAQPGEEDYVLSGAGEWVPQTGGGGTYTLPIATASTLGGIKVGDGLSIDPATGVLSATGGGGGGDSIAEGDGITITTDPQTGVKTISVDTGNGLQINQDGEVEIDPSIIPEVPEYSAGDAITIRDVSSTLPAGYVEVDYIEGIGNYTVINYIPNRKTKIVGTASQTQTSYDPVLFGTRTGSSGQQFVFWFNNYDSTQAKVGFVYGTNTWSTSTDCNNGRLIPYTLGDQFTFLTSLDDEFNINNSFVHNITENGAPASNLKLGIFALVSNSSDEIESSDQIFKGRIYEFKIYEDDELVVNLIPAINTSTNIGGFYDVINDVFYTSKTAAPFGYDPSTIHSTGKVIDVNYGNGLAINQNNELEVNTGDGLSVNANNEVEITKATTNTLGGIKVGSGFVYTSDGLLNATPAAPPFDVGDGLELIYDDIDALPSGYGHVDYVCSNPENNLINAHGRARTLIDYIPTNTTKLAIRMQRDSDRQDLCFVGSRVASRDHEFCFWNEYDSVTELAFAYGNTNYSNAYVTYSSYITGQIIEVECVIGDTSNTLSVDGSVVKTYTKSGDASPYKLGIFQLYLNESWGHQPANGKIYYIKLYEGDTLVVNLIPAVRLIDEAVGFYDNINDKFYTSNTEYPFTTNMTSLVIDGGNRTLNAKIGAGLSFDGNGAIQATAQPLSPATDSTLGGVIVGDGILVDSDGTISVDPTIIPEVIDYEAGTAISIEDVEHGGVTFDAWDSGTGWENVCYQDSTGNSVVVWQYEAHSPISNSYTLPAGATHIRAISRDQNDTMLWTSFSWIDSNNYHFASTTPDVFDDWFEIPTGAVKVNFGVRHSKLDTSTAMNLNDIKSVDITVQTISEIEIDVWNSGTGWLNGNYYSGTSDTFTTSWYYSYHSNPDAYIPIPEGATHVMVMGISNENDSHFEGGGVNVFSSESHSNHIAWWGCAWEWHEISSDAKFVQIDVKWNNNNTRTISGSDIKSVTLVWKLPALETNQAINVKYGDGLTVNQNNELEVNVGAGLQVNQTTNELEPKLGDGLELDEYNAITVDPFYPNTLILNCVLDDEPFPDLILHFTLDPDE